MSIADAAVRNELLKMQGEINALKQANTQLTAQLGTLSGAHNKLVQMVGGDLTAVKGAIQQIVQRVFGQQAAAPRAPVTAQVVQSTQSAQPAQAAAQRAAPVQQVAPPAGPAPQAPAQAPTRITEGWDDDDEEDADFE